MNNPATQIRYVQDRPVGHYINSIALDPGFRYELWTEDFPEPGPCLVAFMPSSEMAERLALSQVLNPQVKAVSIYVRKDVVHADEPEEMIAKVVASGPLAFWLLRNQPQDYPDRVVARLFLSLNGMPLPTRHVMLCPDGVELEASLLKADYTRFSCATVDPTIRCAYI